jgi:hypothetical protein
VAEFVLDFLWCVMCERDIFGVDPEQEQKGILSVGSRARDDFFYTKTHTPRVCCETTHTLKHARRERERERGNDDADDGAYYYYYFCSFR